MPSEGCQPCFLHQHIQVQVAVLPGASPTWLPGCIQAWGSLDTRSKIERSPMRAGPTFCPAATAMTSPLEIHGTQQQGQSGSIWKSEYSAHAGKTILPDGLHEDIFCRNRSRMADNLISRALRLATGMPSAHLLRELCQTP